ncbi:PIG-L deacetylase family protein [Cribrihabitans pelagius]|uniref:PIG-L deacetylase family protein n=1 Tax=Cribrihabitans pelagius TaxID=1765746 RepID=UPI003B59EF30
MNVARRQPLADVFEGREKLVVLAPHPDDEALACGVLLAHTFAGAGGHVICITDGSASHPQSLKWPSERLAERRRAEMIEAIECLGGTANDLTWLGLPDSRLHEADAASVAADLDAIIVDLGVAHVFSPAVEDHHEDHQAVARMARELRRRRPEWWFYSYPVWSRWDDPRFAENISCHDPVFLPPGNLRDAKRAAISAHRTQLGQIVPDDPSGFVLSPAFVEKFVREDEIFWRMP